MLRANLSAIRAAHVLNQPEMLIDAVNEMEKTVLELHTAFKSTGKPE